MVELIKGWAKRLKEPAAWIGWKAAEAAIGGLVGLLLVSAYLRYR